MGVWKLGSKYKFDARNYVPIWPYGNNYIYYPSDIPVMLTALTKYLAYGGMDGVLNGSNDLNGKVVTLSYFVKHKGNMTIAPKTLAPVGKEVLDTLAKFVSAKEAAQAADLRTSKRMIAQAFIAAFAFLKVVKKYIMLLPFDSYDIVEEYEKKTTELKANGDIEGLDQLFFAHNGFKNILHNELRAAQKRIQAGKLDPWKDRNTIGVWGDLDQAIDMLGRF